MYKIISYMGARSVAGLHNDLNHREIQAGCRREIYNL